MAAVDDAEKTKIQISRILGALKIDPYDVLDMPYTATDSELNKAYRLLSLTIHPDKVSAALKDDAQAAFAKLSQAKQDLSDGIFSLIGNSMAVL